MTAPSGVVFTVDWFSDAQCALLAHLAASTTGIDGEIVEVGCWEGKSTLALARAVEPAIVHAVDWWQGDRPDADVEGRAMPADADYEATYQRFLSNVRAGTAGNVSVHRQDWRAFPIPERLRFVHLDGTHAESEVREQIAAFLPRLQTGGVLCGDDWGHAPVARAVTALLPDAQNAGNFWWYQKRAPVLDVFLYSGGAGEREVLDIRLRELEGIATAHLAVEGAFTFQGQPRELALQRDLDRLCGPQAHIHGKIGLHVVSDYPPDAGPWEREAWQRNYLSSAITRLWPGQSPETIVLLSDADEIPHRDAVPAWLAPGTTYRLCQRHFMYALNVECVTWGHWHGTRVIRLDDLLAMGPEGPQTLRGFGIGHLHRPEDRPAGWHFSFLGGQDAIAAKLASWSHAEAAPYNRPENIERALTTLTDWQIDRGAQLVPVALDDSWPACVVAHPERYSTLMREGARWVRWGSFEAVPV